MAKRTVKDNIETLAGAIRSGNESSTWCTGADKWIFMLADSIGIKNTTRSPATTEL